jgi:hypothetical protein
MNPQILHSAQLDRHWITATEGNGNPQAQTPASGFSMGNFLHPREEQRELAQDAGFPIRQDTWLVRLVIIHNNEGGRLPTEHRFLLELKEAKENTDVSKPIAVNISPRDDRTSVKCKRFHHLLGRSLARSAMLTYRVGEDMNPESINKLGGQRLACRWRWSSSIYVVYGEQAILSGLRLLAYQDDAIDPSC